MKKAEAGITENLAEHYVSIHEKRMLLTGIMRRQSKMNRFFKMKDEIKILEDDLPPSMLLRAIDMDTRLENGWYDRKPVPELKGEKKLKKEEPKPMPLERYIYFGTKPFAPEDPVITEDELTALWQMSLTHDNIHAPSPGVPDKYIGKMKLEKSPRTGRWVVAYAAPGILEEMEKDERNLSKPIKIPAHGIDPESFADMIKNSEVLRRTYNREIGIALFSGSGMESEAGKDKAPGPVKDHLQGTPGQQENESHFPYLEQTEEKSSNPGIFNSDFKSPSSDTKAKSRSGDFGVSEYRPVKEIWEEYMKTYQNHASQKNHKRYLEAKAMYFAKDAPSKKRKAIELKSPWEFHPDNPQLMRKKTA